MLARPQRKKKVEGKGGGSAPSKPKQKPDPIVEPEIREFISSGCTPLDKNLGGGWALGRMANIIGDKSTGKTLLAIEAAANFHRKFPEGKIWYRETEAAFDKSYAASLGMPISAVDFGKKKLDTVEQFYTDLKAKAEWCAEKDRPGLYILDSLDALSDEAEMEREIDKASYGQGKAKKLSELFRKLARALENGNMALLIISQIRDNIGVSFGRKYRRSGGHAMDFYATHCVWLAHIETVTAQRKGIKRAIGVRIKAKVEKNKVSVPFRECEFNIKFGFGVDDFDACIDWLMANKCLDEVGLSQNTISELNKKSDDLPDDEYKKHLKELRKAVRRGWDRVETSFLPKRKKYG